ncbi:MAG: prepilin-type N-terminal cleavage/methylation domain-containing protein, partial [Thermodesulfobacteriota bacterium]
MIRQIHSKMKDRKGFTLIELMIVIAILGVLAAVAIPFYNQYIENSKMRIARSNYETAVRTVKTEFANVTAGNLGAT